MISSSAERQELRAKLADAQAQLRRSEARLADRTSHDPRTRLLALDAFRIAAEQKLRNCERDSTPVSAAVIDIDGFRELNARRGHAAGDAALIGVASRLRDLTRDSDVLGRSGADDITVVMPETDMAGARACCDSLIEMLGLEEIPGAGSVSVSAGLATHQSGGTLSDLLAGAQSGVDRARALGGCRSEARLDDGTSVTASATQTAVVNALAGTMLTRDRYTGQHSDAVVELSRRVASQLGMSSRDIETVAAAAQLHDIGKVGVPDRVLDKPGALNDDEWGIVREYPLVGERILRAIPGMSNVAQIVRHEHEHWNGAGYPDNLRGDQIPLGSRIVLACDAYTAITTDRPYRSAREHGAAVAELSRCAGTQFDPKVTEALIGCLYWQRQTGKLVNA